MFLIISCPVSGTQPNSIDSLSLPPLQEFYIQVLSDETGSNTGYLDNTGQTHTQCHLASPWQLIDEFLFSGNGNQLISVGHNVPYIRFGVVDILDASSLDQAWVPKPDGIISWHNRAFQNGAATFGEDTRGILYAIFSGPGPSNLTSVFLQALNVNDCHDLPQASSSAPTASATTAALAKTSSVVEPILTPSPSASFTPSPFNCDFETSEYNGKAVVSVAYESDEGPISTDDANPYTCCQTCQTTPGCVYSLFDVTGSGCTLTLASGQGCSQKGYFYTSTTAAASIVIANGTCGIILYGGDVSATASTSVASVTPSKVVSTSPTSLPPNSSICDNGISSVNGEAITTVKADVEGTFQNSAATPYDCCVSCQNEAGCQYAQFSTVSGCTLALASGQCAPGSYFTNATAPVSMTLYNGTCGGVTHGGTSSPPTNSTCDNGISSVNGQAITTVIALVEGTFQNSAATPYDCCVSCQNEAGCQYAEFSTVSGCTLALASGQCVAGSYYTDATAPVSITLYNGTCGGVAHGGTVGYYQ